MHIRTIFISDCKENIKFIHNEIQRLDINMIIQHASSKELIKTLFLKAEWDLILFDNESKNLNYLDIVGMRDDICSVVPILMVYGDLEPAELIKVSKEGINGFIPILKLFNISKTIEYAIDDVNDRIQQKKLSRGASRQLISLDPMKDRYQLAVESTGDAIWDWDIEANDLFISEEWQNTIGYGKNSEEALIEYYKKLIHPADTRSLFQALNDYLNKKSSSFQYEFRMRMQSGEYIWLLIKGKALWSENGQPMQMIGHMIDITEHKKSGEKANYLAYYDPLTELANRALFEYKLSSTIASLTPGQSNSRIAVIYIDIDNFSMYKDVKGHIFGDKILRKTASLLLEALTEEYILSRLGDDEFAVLIQNIESIDQVRDIADRVMQLFKNELVIDGFPITVSISMGVALYPEDGEDEQSLLRNAHTALYFAKNLGKNNYQYYKEYMNDKVTKKLSLEKKLREAVKNNEFIVHYQPQISIETSKIVGMEALVRWFHPTDGVIQPADFIPLAEETGLIVEIGEFVLRTACRQNKLWQKKGLPSKRIAVNISAKQLKDINFVSTIKKVLEETGLEPMWLEIEITESLVMQNLDLTVEILCELKKMGVYIALDDFGTGYSSLNYLRRLPIDTLKIDKSFVDEIHTGYNEQAITKAIIGLAHNIKLDIVAEGVESSDQLMYLKEYACDKVQGYLFSRPLSSEEFELMLSSETNKQLY